MFYRSYTPAPPLGNFIGRFWLCSDTPSHPRERILPSGTIELVVNLRDDEIRIYDSSHPDGANPPRRKDGACGGTLCDLCSRFSGAVVSGTYSRCFVIDPLQHAAILGVHFRPGGAFPFLGAPAGELADAHLDLDTLWGPPALELRERLCAAATPAARFSLLEEALLSRLRHPPEHHSAVPVALAAFEQTDGGLTVRDVARRVGLSQRRFIQVFAAEVGLTPKLYCRVRRFQRARALVEDSADELGLPKPFDREAFQRARALVQDSAAPDWAQIAVECGYYDQSHLIHDFREFSGLSPTDYVRRRSEQVLPNHVPLAE